MEIEEYIILTNPQGVNNLIQSYGVPPAQSEQELLYCVYQLAHEKGTPFVADLLELHPDADVLFEMQEKGYRSPLVNDALTRINEELKKIPIWIRIGAFAFMAYATINFLFKPRK